MSSAGFTPFGGTTETLRIAGRVCRVLRQGTDDASPYVYWGAGTDCGAEAAELAGRIASAAPDRPFVLVAYEAEDWNRDFSPWPAPPVWGREGFAGGGAETARWLTDECAPRVEGKRAGARLIAGYSLAGLFSLWAFYGTGRFAGAASCSGSLWFPGWADYARAASAPAQSLVYLSLGRGEEHAKNAALAAVGDRTRDMDALLSRDENIRRHALEWHDGGHFRDVPARMAQGIAWLLWAL